MADGPSYVPCSKKNRLLPLKVNPALDIRMFVCVTPGFRVTVYFVCLIYLRGFIHNCPLETLPNP